MNHANLYENAFAAEMNTAITDAASLNAAIAPTSATNFFTTPFTTSSLGQQLKMIARLIQAAPSWGTTARFSSRPSEDSICTVERG